MAEEQMHPVLKHLWRALDGSPTLSAIAAMATGVYCPVQRPNAPNQCASVRPGEGYQSGLVRLGDGFEPFLISGHMYLKILPAADGARLPAPIRDWDRPKVVVNRPRLSRGAWVMATAPDRDGLVLSHRFHALWPSAQSPLEVLAAIASGPVANAFMSTHRTSRENRITTLNQIPIPRFRPEAITAITAAVDAYRSLRLRRITEGVPERESNRDDRRALLRIDAELLTAYDLPPRVERELLDYFASHRRPGPASFDRYYPDDFRPSLPLRMMVDGDLERAGARQTLGRLPVFRDPAVSEMVADLD